MGFSWSSAVAQDCMLEVCRLGGADLCHVLADDVPVTSRLDKVFALATDDIMQFVRASRDEAIDAASDLDAGFIKAGVLRHEA